jgi:hypothetical protein
MKTQRPPLALAALLSLLAVGCSSPIGNQQFYALEPTHDLPIHNQQIYRVLTPDDYADCEDALSGDEDPSDSLKAYYQAFDHGIMPIVLTDAFVTATSNLGGQNRQPLGLLEARRLLARLTGATTNQAANRPLLRRVTAADELRPGDVLLTQVEIGERENGSQARFFELRLDSTNLMNSISTSYLAKRSHSLGVTNEPFASSWLSWSDGEDGRQLVELTITEALGSTTDFDSSLGDERDALASAENYWEVAGSLIPMDAALPYRLISPSVDSGNGERIQPGFPLTIIANRLFLASDGDPGIYGTGEIAVVATVSEGGSKPRSFLAAYHENVDSVSFVPFWGAILYSTVSWSGEPITIKIQVIDLDDTDNAYFGSLLSSASEAAGTLAPALQPDFGIARALGDTLLSNNQDDEILRFEFTFVNDSSEFSTNSLIPRNRSYVVLRPDSGIFVNPAEVEFTDQWQLRPRNRTHWRDAWTDESGAPVDYNDFAREWIPFVDKSPAPPSYVSVTTSDSIVIPEAVMVDRQGDLQRRIANFSPDGNAAEQLKTLQDSLGRMASVPLYVDYLGQIMKLPKEATPSPATLHSIAGIAASVARMDPRVQGNSNGNASPPSRVPGSLTEPDRLALLTMLQRRFPESGLGNTWSEIATNAKTRASQDTRTKLELALGRLARKGDVTDGTWENALSLARQASEDVTLTVDDRTAVFAKIVALPLLKEQLAEIDDKLPDASSSWPDLIGALDKAHYQSQEMTLLAKQIGEKLKPFASLDGVPSENWKKALSLAREVQERSTLVASNKKALYSKFAGSAALKAALVKSNATLPETPEAGTAVPWQQLIEALQKGLTSAQALPVPTQGSDDEPSGEEGTGT